uniref:Uncharacterized protein n=1 Tax=Sphaerodactylus townsendi TaxID=933632 RepID=A0ACB8FP52_9SAUR
MLAARSPFMRERGCPGLPGGSSPDLTGRALDAGAAACPSNGRPRSGPAAPSPSGGGNVPSSVLRDNEPSAAGQAAERVTAATPLPGPASLQDEGRIAPEGTGAGFKVFLLYDNLFLKWHQQKPAA